MHICKLYLAYMHSIYHEAIPLLSATNKHLNRNYHKAKKDNCVLYKRILKSTHPKFLTVIDKPNYSMFVYHHFIFSKDGNLNLLLVINGDNSILGVACQ